MMSEEKKEKPPEKFWLVVYGSLIWHREKAAFIPIASIFGSPGKETSTPIAVMREYAYMEGEEAEAQAKELRALGVSARTQSYKLHGEVGKEGKSE
jgi:hypothetical protein